jgi:hypothetical protein
MVVHHFMTLMIAVTRTPELVAVLAVFGLYGVVLWFLNQRFHRRLEAVFSQHRGGRPTFAEIGEVLDDLNLDSAHFVFAVERHANIRFREKDVTLVYGRVGTRSPGGIRGPVWTLRKAVYALADEGQTAWMKGCPEVFTGAMSGYRFAVFWVKLEEILKG